MARVPPSGDTDTRCPSQRPLTRLVVTRRLSHSHICNETRNICIFISPSTGSSKKVLKRRNYKRTYIRTESVRRRKSNVSNEHSQVLRGVLETGQFLYNKLVDDDDDDDDERMNFNVA